VKGVGGALPSPNTASVLHIHRAERADGLVEALGEVVSPPLDDAFQAEIVAVPTRGVERWLAQRLSAVLGTSAGRTDGVCANVDFPFPGTLLGAAVAAATGVDPETDPWQPARAVWPLLELVDEHLGEPWLGPLSSHLGGDETRRSRRFSSLRHVADLYERYAVQRPALIRSWAGGQGDGWQPELWRRLRRRIGTPSPAERLEQACAALRSDPKLPELPRRLSLFGLTRLPASQLDVLAALAEHRDVHLFLLHPSAVLWDEVAAGRQLPRNPLLASWGRDSRDLQLVLAGAGPAELPPHRVVPESAATLLQRVQADVRADRLPPGLPLPGGADSRAALDPDDRSLQVHACHGRARQVEVVRDAILHVLQEDPTLEPRDIVVMCPDIESFAPLIHATFGSTSLEDDDEPAPAERTDLRVRLADRSIRQTNPLLGVVAELLDLADGRLTASQVLDLAGRAPVRRRFRLDDDDLARIARWAADSGVRFGLDAPQRAAYQLDRVSQNTWESGFDRILAGVTMADERERLIGGVLPLDDVPSGDIDLAGRFAELLDRLRQVVVELTGERPLSGWVTAIADAADALAEAPPNAPWQRVQLARLLDEVAGEGTAAAEEIPLALPEIRTLLAERLRGRPTRASFRTGHLTMCTLVPMRSVPHRVIVLMGLDDGVFPRQADRDGDDLLLADPQVGDRDARSEDRQLLLDALLAATDRLVVTYTGRDERTNVERPPAVPIGELLDVVERTCRCERAAIVTQHPLQPFDERNYRAGALADSGPWSFDPVSLAGARALAGERLPRPRFLRRPLEPKQDPVLELEDLVRFVQHPVRAFLRQRLGFGVGEPEEEIDDSLPVELDALQQWNVGERLLTARLAGASEQAAVQAELARQMLPPGSLARPVLDEVWPDVEALVDAARDELGQGAARAVDVRLALPDGRLLVGTVPGVRDGLAAVLSYSRLGPKHRLASWARHLAISAAHPGQGFEALAIGRRRRDGPRNATVSVARIGALGPDEAQAAVEALVDLYDRALREPLPLYCATSAAYAIAVHAGNDPRRPVEWAWKSTWRFPSEDADPEHQLVLGGKRAFEELLSDPRFDDLARELWEPLLRRELVTDR
jgi:exodeoxyribonuclease V gamma subunit